MNLFGSSRKKKLLQQGGAQDIKAHPSLSPLLCSCSISSSPLPCPTSSHHLRQAYPPPNVVVNQHYYVIPSLPAPGSEMPVCHKGSLTKLKLGSVVNLLPANVPHLFDDGLPSWHACGSRLLNQGAAFYDQFSSNFDNVLTLIDRDRFSDDKGDYLVYNESSLPQSGHDFQEEAVHSTTLKTGPEHFKNLKGETTAAASLISGNYIAKVAFYANSRLPTNLPPMNLYIATYPLLSLAAKYSDRVYQQPQGAERFFHIDADWRAGTKAMVIKSVPMDHANTIVFAIRGTATFMDWAVNLNMAPTSPVNFLDDLGNFCHAGFLSVARKMVKPVAARLRQLLEEDPGRASYSLLITGHSAGGAVAALLYSHMLASSQQAESELNYLAGCFRRIHCITFGSPPVSLLPLTKPDRNSLRKSVFLSFVNEGDPVVRADKAYVKSLFELFASSAPASVPTGYANQASSGTGPRADGSEVPSRSHKSSKSGKPSHKNGKSKRSYHSQGCHEDNIPYKQNPVWKVPQSTLSNAGRIVVLRSGDPRARPEGRKTVEQRLNEGVVAQMTTDEQLREVIWGDPVCHVMKLYAGRIETIAIGAVTADG